MAKRYLASGPDAGGTGPQTLLNIIGSTAIRPQVFEFDISSATTPADQVSTIWLSRTTAVGTSAGAPPTPALLDPGDVAAVCTVGWTHSSEPTYSSPTMYQLPLNQRASWRWVANPGFEIIGSATASNGIGLKKHLASGTVTCTGTIFWAE